MNQAQLLVNVTCRGIPLVTRAVLDQVSGEGGFLPSDSPMPVGTELALIPVEAAGPALRGRVRGVVELRKSARNPENERPGMWLRIQSTQGLSAQPAESPAGVGDQVAEARAETDVPDGAASAEDGAVPEPAREVADETEPDDGGKPGKRKRAKRTKRRKAGEEG